MAFYSHPAPFQLYTYAPMPIPNHEFYAVYPPGGHPAVGAPIDGSQFYYEPSPKGTYTQSGQCFWFYLEYVFASLKGYIIVVAHKQF